MFTKSAVLKFVCLGLSVILTNCQIPVFVESRPPPPAFVALPPPSLYGPQVPIVSASVKSPPVVVAPAPAPAPAPVPLPPVTRARIGVKTVVRPPPPTPIRQQPVPIIEQHELVITFS